MLHSACQLELQHLSAKVFTYLIIDKDTREKMYSGEERRGWGEGRTGKVMGSSPQRRSVNICQSPTSVAVAALRRMGERRSSWGAASLAGRGKVRRE